MQRLIATDGGRLTSGIQFLLDTLNSNPVVPRVNLRKCARRSQAAGRFSFQGCVMAIRKPCARAGCSRLVPIGTPHCKQHTVEVREGRWKESDQRRRHSPHRAIYKKKAWRVLRLQVLARDEYRCQWPGCGVLCHAGRRGERAAEVDHKAPHNGDEVLAYDPSNCWTLCKHCHSTHKQRQEMADRSASRRSD